MSADRSTALVYLAINKVNDAVLGHTLSLSNRTRLIMVSGLPNRHFVHLVQQLLIDHAKVIGYFASRDLIDLARRSYWKVVDDVDCIAYQVGCSPGGDDAGCRTSGENLDDDLRSLVAGPEDRVFFEAFPIDRGRGERVGVFSCEERRALKSCHDLIAHVCARVLFVQLVEDWVVCNAERTDQLARVDRPVPHTTEERLMVLEELPRIGGQ